MRKGTKGIEDGCGSGWYRSMGCERECGWAMKWGGAGNYIHWSLLHPLSWRKAAMTLLPVCNNG